MIAVEYSQDFLSQIQYTRLLVITYVNYCAPAV